jgi:hypothetical protein
MGIMQICHMKIIRVGVIKFIIQTGLTMWMGGSMIQERGSISIQTIPIIIISMVMKILHFTIVLGTIGIIMETDHFLIFVIIPTHIFEEEINLVNYFDLPKDDLRSGL